MQDLIVIMSLSCHDNSSMFSYRIVESFEVISTQYVQQLPPNTQVSFVAPSLTVIGENVSSMHTAVRINDLFYYYTPYYVLI